MEFLRNNVKEMPESENQMKNIFGRLRSRSDIAEERISKLEVLQKIFSN